MWWRPGGTGNPGFESRSSVLWAPLTFQGVLGQAQLADDVARQVSLHTLVLAGLALCGLQQMVEFLWVELLERRGREPPHPHGSPEPQGPRWRLTRHSSSRAGLEMMMSSLRTSCTMKPTSALSDRS